MAWRDDYRPGSFRGVPFVTERHERAGGRRAEVHEFPQRDLPLAEDLGRAARRFSIDCHVIGADYRVARDRLIDALEAAGPGTLVHPFHGTLRVQVLDYRQSESTEEGGIARFSIECVEAGAAADLTVAPDPRVQALSVADKALADAPAAFARGFDVSGLPGFVEMAASALVESAGDLTRVVAGFSGGAGNALRGFEAALDLVGQPQLLRQPLALGTALVGLFSAVDALTGDARVRRRMAEPLIAFGTGLHDVAATTPARTRQRANQAAFVHLTGVAATALLVRATADTAFSSYDEAVTTRDSAAALIDARALAAADALDTDRALDFDRLRRAMVRDITARGGTLQRVYGYRPAATEPALGIAHRLYGPVADLVVRTDAMVARNRVRHPGFVPGGAPIEVLADG